VSLRAPELDLAPAVWTQSGIRSQRVISARPSNWCSGMLRPARATSCWASDRSTQQAGRRFSPHAERTSQGSYRPTLSRPRPSIAVGGAGTHRAGAVEPAPRSGTRAATAASHGGPRSLRWTVSFAEHERIHCPVGSGWRNCPQRLLSRCSGNTCEPGAGSTGAWLGPLISSDVMTT